MTPRAALLALALLVCASSVSAAGPLNPGEPIFNGDFSIGMPSVLQRPAPVTETLVWDLIGSAAPGGTDPYASRPAAGWTHRVFSGQREATGTATWVANGMVAIRVEPEDSGPATAVLSQTLGQRDFVSFWRGPFEVDVTVASITGPPPQLRVFAATPGFADLKFTPSQRAEPGVMTFAFESDASVAQFMLAFEPGAAPATLVIDEIRIRGATPGITVATP